MSPFYKAGTELGAEDMTHVSVGSLGSWRKDLHKQILNIWYDNV